MNANATGQWSILLIDDEEMVRETIFMMLDDDTNRVRQAGDGNEGLKAMEEAPADLVICDIIMPDKEGIETIAEIRERWPGTKIIAISGGGRTSNLDFLEIARKLGADEVLGKPFDALTLVQTVERVLAAPTSGNDG